MISPLIPIISMSSQPKHPIFAIEKGAPPGVQDHGVGASHGAARHENLKKNKESSTVLNPFF